MVVQNSTRIYVAIFALIYHTSVNVEITLWDILGILIVTAVYHQPTRALKGQRTAKA